MNGGGEREYGRGAKDLNLRPFAARGAKPGEGLDMSRPAEELFEAEPAESDKQAAAYGEVAAALEAAPKKRGQRARGPKKDAARPAKGADAGAGESRVRRKRPLTEREKLTLERQRKFARFIAACIAAVVFLAALLLAWFLLIVDEIGVAGCERFTPEQIVESSGLKTGRHIWLVNLAEAEERVEANPYIENADIKRIYPDKLLISVGERVEAAVIVGLNAQAVIDPAGYVLSIGARAHYDGLIKIAGMGSGGYHVGQRLGEESDFNSRTLVALLEAIYAVGIETELALVDMSNPLSVSMTTAEGLILHIGQPDDLANKLSNYLAVLPRLRELGLCASGTLDLSAMGDPVYSPRDGTQPTDDGSASPSPPGTSPLPGGSPGDPEDGFSG